MRRVLSIVLVFFFGFPLISPLLGLTAGAEGNLPVCCRRGGAHHCMLKMEQTAASDGSVSFSAPPRRCPAYPAAVAPVRHGDLSVPAAALIFAGVVAHPSVKQQTEARARVALDRARQKRGPPAESV